MRPRRRDLDDPAFVEALTRARRAPTPPPTTTTRSSPTRSRRWIETTFGLDDEPGTGRLRPRRRRARSAATDGAADELAELDRRSTEDVCATRSATTLLAGYRARDPETGFPVFAFRLHQFFSRGDTVYASLEPEDDRYVTTQRAAVRPGRSRTRAAAARLLPRVRPGVLLRRARRPDRTATPSSCRASSDDTHRRRGDATPGFLYVELGRALAGRPEASARARPRRLARGRATASAASSELPRKYLPAADPRRPGRARSATTGCACHFVPAPFRFCLRCGVAYGGRQPTRLRQARDARRRGPEHARRRSSASPRSAACAATRRSSPRRASSSASPTTARTPRSRPATSTTSSRSACSARRSTGRPTHAGADGLAHDELAAARCSTRSPCPLELYAVDPDVRFAARRTRPTRALRDVLGYRLYRDLERGWRSPRRTSSSAGCSRSTTRRSTSSARPRTSGQARHPALARRHARATRATIAQASCSTSCAASWRSRSTT